MSLWGDPPSDERAALEARNGLRLFDYIRELVERHVGGDAVLITPEIVCRMNEIAVDGLTDNPGEYRDDDVTMLGSKHLPPHHRDVPGLVVEMCSYAESDMEPLTRAAYVLWRLNWIHPFQDGNGRTARAAMYFVLCRDSGGLISGSITVPERIARQKRKYYLCLEEADAIWRRRRTVNVTNLAGFLGRLRKEQEGEMP